MALYLNSSSDTLNFYLIYAAWEEKILLLTRQFDIYRALQNAHAEPTSSLEVVYAGLASIQEIESGFGEWILISQGKSTYRGFALYE